MASKQTPFDKALSNLEKVMTQDFEAINGITREGDKIIIPSYMTYKSAARALIEHESKMEQDASKMMHFDANPNDALVAFYRAVTSQFGNMMGQAVETWFGIRPAKAISVDIDYGETLTVPIGAAEVPGLPISFKIMPEFDPLDDDGGYLEVVAEYKMLYEGLVTRIEQAALEYLRVNSIFRGKAIDSRWNFLNAKRFDVSRVVYSARERRQIEANILTPITETDRWVDSGSSLKRGILLYGPYGTGKTLTAMLTARTCVENGWTFVNVLPGDDVVKAIKFASRFEPAVVFLEDIDTETGGERGSRLNEILNTIDGVLSKSSRVMTVLTTNHVEQIHRAMLRPGRLDALIPLGDMDANSVYELITAVSKDCKDVNLISGDIDKDALYEAAQGLVPAFIVEAVTKAKAYALRRGGDGKPSITQEDVIEALNELRPQWELMKSDRPDKDHNFQDAFDSAVKDSVTAVLDPRFVRRN